MSYDPYDYDYDTEGQGDYDAATPYSSLFFTPEQIALQNALLGGGDPMAGLGGSQPLDMYGLSAIPQLDTKGREQPYDLGVAQQRLNYGQDIGTSMTNPFIQYMGGPGAYAPGALDPVYDEKRLDMLQGRQLEMMRQSGGIRGLLADFILGNPAEGRPAMDSSQAAARVRAMIQNSTGDDPEIENLKGELLPVTDQFGAAGDQPDFSIINKMADEIYKPYVAEQAMLQQPDVKVMPDGRVVQLTQRDSPTMEFLKKVGLPDPRARYDVEFALQNDPTLMTLMQTQATSQSERDMIRKEYDDRVKRIQKRRDQSEADNAEMEKFKSATQAAMAEYFSGVGGVGRARTAAPIPQGQRGVGNQWRNEDIAQGQRGLGNQWPGGAEAEPVAQGMRGLGNQWRRGGPPDLNLPAAPDVGVHYSMVDSILGKPQRDKRQALADEAVPDAMLRMINLNKRRRLEGEGTEAAWQYAMRLAPIINAGRRGQTPASDAIKQRLAPLYGMGAMGQ